VPLNRRTRINEKKRKKQHGKMKKKEGYLACMEKGKQWYLKENGTSAGTKDTLLTVTKVIASISRITSYQFRPTCLWNNTAQHTTQNRWINVTGNEGIEFGV
jgi:hypothetical protein